MNMEINPLLIPIIATIFGTAMIVGIVAIVHWYKAREKELQYHQDMRVRLETRRLFPDMQKLYQSIVLWTRHQQVSMTVVQPRHSANNNNLRRGGGD